MKVGEVMTPDVELAAPDDTVQTAAKLMADSGAGALPVGEKDRLVGMVTDRDITVRALAEGKAPNQCTVRDVMTSDIKYVFEDDEISDASRKMGEWQVRRLPVLNRDKRLVGVISLGDIASQARDKQAAAKAMEGVTRTTGKKEQ